MKRIESFKELCQLPFGSIVCTEICFSGKKGFAIINHGTAEIHCGSLSLFDQEQRNLYGKNGISCSFVVSSVEGFGYTIFEGDDFSCQNLYLFEASDIAELWQSLMHLWPCPENTCNDTVKALLLGVMQFHPRRGGFACHCVPEEKFRGFNKATK